MGFLSNLTMLQRAGGAAVLVLILVMLLVKQRQAKGAPAAKSADGKKDTFSKKRVSAPKEKKGRSFGSKRKSDDDLDLPVAEPKAGSGRMVPRLPAASEAAADEIPAPEPVAFSEVAEPAIAVPMPTADGMISEPGWPTPGEVWAAPDAALGESADIDSWHAGSQDDALAALTEIPEAHTTEWASDESADLDEPAGWETSFEDVAVPAGQTDATWQAEAETFDWGAGGAIEGWATSAASEPAEDLTSGEAAWEAPEDEATSWSANETAEWNALKPVEETVPAATAVAEAFSVSKWTPPETAAEVVADEPTTVVEAIPDIVWEPVDEVEDVDDEIASKADVVVAEPEVAAPVDEPEMMIVAEAPVVEEPAVAVLEAPVVEEPAVAVLEAPVVEEPAVAVLEAPVVEEPAVAVLEAPAVEVEPFEAEFEAEVPTAPVAPPHRSPIPPLVGHRWHRVVSPRVAARPARLTVGRVCVRARRLTTHRATAPPRLRRRCRPLPT